MSPTTMRVKKYGKRIAATRKAWFAIGLFREPRALPIVWAVLKKTMKQALSRQTPSTTRRWLSPARPDRQDCRLYPRTEVIGDPDADLLIVGWGGTYGHLYEAMETMQEQGKKVALAHFKFISPLPKNTAEVLSKYKKVVVAEQNNGQFANYLRGKVTGFNPYRFNRVKGQPFVVARLVEEFTKILEA